MDDARCRIARAALGLTEDELAVLAGVTPDAIRDLESGARAPSASGSVVAQRVAEALRRCGVSFRVEAAGRVVMRAETLDGIIEAPVDMRSHS